MFNDTLVGLVCIGALLLGLILVFRRALNNLSMVRMVDKGIKRMQVWRDRDRSLDKRPDKKPDSGQQGKE
jgi:hypothetical protein